jgi:hypothetical protein
MNLGTARGYRIQNCVEIRLQQLMLTYKKTQSLCSQNSPTTLIVVATLTINNKSIFDYLQTRTYKE